MSDLQTVLFFLRFSHKLLLDPLGCSRATVFTLFKNPSFHGNSAPDNNMLNFIHTLLLFSLIQEKFRHLA